MKIKGDISATEIQGATFHFTNNIKKDVDIKSDAETAAPFKWLPSSGANCYYILWSTKHQHIQISLCRPHLLQKTKIPYHHRQEN